MNTEKNTCIFFKTLFDAAEKIKETNPGDALEIYSAFFKYAFGYTERIETSSMIAELVVMQNIPSFEAAANRYNAAVENGKKGKEFGILGKEYGKLGGRPRKNTSKTPQKTPLTVSVSNSKDKSISKDNSVEINKEDNKTVVTGIPTKALEPSKETFVDDMMKNDDVPQDAMTSPGTPNACQPVKSRLESFDLAAANKLPDMERRLEHQYYYVLKDLPALLKKRTDFDERYYLKETLDWLDDKTSFTMTQVMLNWYDGGREKLAEMVQGLTPQVTKDILTYLVIYCKERDASGYYGAPALQVVYAA